MSNPGQSEEEGDAFDAGFGIFFDRSRSFSTASVSRSRTSSTSSNRRRMSRFQVATKKLIQVRCRESRGALNEDWMSEANREKG